MRAYACSLSLAIVQRWHGKVPSPGSRLATTLIATSKPLPSGETQLFVVTASVTDSFDAKLNERLKERRDALETDRDEAVLAANLVAFEEKHARLRRGCRSAAAHPDTRSPRSSF
jgi:hypothetical protein